VPPIHLGWLRCSSLTYSSMLASHALPAKRLGDSWWTTYFFLTPKAVSYQLSVVNEDHKSRQKAVILCKS